MHVRTHTLYKSRRTTRLCGLTDYAEGDLVNGGSSAGCPWRSLAGGAARAG